MSTIVTVILWCIVVLIILYLFMVMPRVIARPDMRPFQKFLYAHRGLHDNNSDAPENSMAAFKKAVDAGFGIEMDVQLTKDRIPVVFHDFTLERVCGGEGKVYDYTYKELQQFNLCGSGEKIPLFADVLKLVDGKVPLIIELKIESTDAAVCPIADRILSDYKGLYCIESFNPFGLHWYRCNRGQIIRGQLSDAFLKLDEYRDSKGGERMLYFALQNLLLNFLGRPDFIAYNHKYSYIFNRKLCRGLFRARAAAWTIKSPEELIEAEKHFDIFIFDSFVPEKIPKMNKNR